MTRVVLSLCVVLGLAALVPASAEAFCGFFVSKADTKLYNKASKVVIVRDGDRTVMTMANDFKGELKEFAVVIPVPTFIQKDQIHVGEQAVIDHLDAFTAPRLVEYFDENPCRRHQAWTRRWPRRRSAASRPAVAQEASAKRLGVTIEATYTVGEYDILILSAKESAGLETWLQQNGYRLPAGAGPVIGSYLKQNMRFFVAKVNLGEQAKLGFTYLRPLQVAYESPKFMLPIRLGTMNAEGAQELFVFALTRKGRVETTNYRTVKLPYRRRDSRLREERLRRASIAPCSRGRSRSTRCRPCSSSMRGTWAGAIPCAADPLSRDGAAQAGRLLARRGPVPAHRAAGRSLVARGCVRHASPRALRRRPLSRGSRLPGDRRSHQLPGPLHPATGLDGQRDVRGGRLSTAGTCRSGSSVEARALASLTGGTSTTFAVAAATRRSCGRRSLLVAPDLEVAADTLSGAMSAGRRRISRIPIC